MIRLADTETTLFGFAMCIDLVSIFTIDNTILAYCEMSEIMLRLSDCSSIVEWDESVKHFRLFGRVSRLQFQIDVIFNNENDIFFTVLPQPV